MTICSVGTGRVSLCVVPTLVGPGAHATPLARDSMSVTRQLIKSFAHDATAAPSDDLRRLLNYTHIDYASVGFTLHCSAKSDGDLRNFDSGGVARLRAIAAKSKVNILTNANKQT